MGDTVLRRRPIDSGISISRNSNDGDEDLEMNSEEDDLVFKETTDPEKKEEISANNTPKSGAIIAVKERLLTTANQLVFGGKYLGIGFLIWFLGYFGFSFLWLAIGIFVYTWREHKRRTKKSVSEVLGNIAKDEKKYFQTVEDIYKLSGRDLPSWVYFPDVEKAEWLNTVLEQLWPYVSDFVKNTIMDKVEPSIRASNQLLKGFKFSKIDMGDKSPRVAGVKVYSNGQTRRTEIVMDLQIIYQSDANIRVTLNRLSVGVKDLSLRGLIRVELRPLISNIPLVGALSVAFVHQPSIDFDLTDLGNFFDFPGVDSVLRAAVADCVHSMMVLPERYVLKLADDVDISKLRYPLPKGVVRIHIIEAKNLEEKDRKILGVGGGSDPYVEVKVGRGHEFRTKIVNHDVNPVWNESFDVTVMEAHTSSIEITLYDDDGALTKDDYLGSASVQLKSVHNEGTIDEWIPLSNVKHGMIHIKIEWLELSDDPAHLTEAMEHAGKHDLNSALLSIYIDSAKELPLKSSETGIAVLDQVQGFLEGRYEPNPVVKVTVPGKVKAFKTKVAANTNNPVWEENFRALVQNPRMESLTFQIHDGDTNDDVLGTLKFKIHEIIKAPNMTKEEPFNLDNSGSKSQLNMRLTARLLIPRRSSAENLTSSTRKSSFVVAKSVLSARIPTLKPEIQIITDSNSSSKEKDVIKEDVIIGGEETEPDSASVREPSDSSSTNSFGIEFVDKSLALFLANSPTNRLETNGAEAHRSSSFASEMSSIVEEEKLASDKYNGTKSEYPLGRLNLTLAYSTRKEKLFIDINKAEKLIVCDEDKNTSDPYVRVYLLPNRRSSQRRKTKVVKNNVNPVFNERFEYEVTKGDLHVRQLDISVKNKAGLLSSEKVLMGKVWIDLAKLELPVTKWYPLHIDAGT